MSDKTSEDHPRQPPSTESNKDAPRRLQRSGEIVVPTEALPPKAPVGKQIHRRRPIPPVPEAEENQKSQNKG
jgi:hypothetical protein